MLQVLTRWSLDWGVSGIFSVTIHVLGIMILGEPFDWNSVSIWLTSKRRRGYRF